MQSQYASAHPDTYIEICWRQSALQGDTVCLDLKVVLWPERRLCEHTSIFTDDYVQTFGRVGDRDPCSGGDWYGVAQQ